MPPPTGHYRSLERLPLRKEFVIFPKHLLNGGWILGTVYHRRVIRQIPNMNELPNLHLIDEYLTKDEAIMAKLNGEE